MKQLFLPQYFIQYLVLYSDLILKKLPLINYCFNYSFAKYNNIIIKIRLIRRTIQYLL